MTRPDASSFPRYRAAPGKAPDTCPRCCIQSWSSSRLGKTGDARPNTYERFLPSRYHELDGSTCSCVTESTIPAQDMVALRRSGCSPVNPQLPLPVLDHLKYSSVPGIDRQIRFVVLMKQLHLPINIPQALLLRGVAVRKSSGGPVLKNVSTTCIAAWSRWRRLWLSSIRKNHGLCERDNVARGDDGARTL